jgi:hypothetical protein
VQGSQFLPEGHAEGGDAELGHAVDGGSADGLAPGDGAYADQVGHSARLLPGGGGQVRQCGVGQAQQRGDGACVLCADLGLPCVEPAAPGT